MIKNIKTKKYAILGMFVGILLFTSLPNNMSNFYWSYVASPSYGYTINDYTTKDTVEGAEYIEVVTDRFSTRSVKIDHGEHFLIKIDNDGTRNIQLLNPESGQWFFRDPSFTYNPRPATPEILDCEYACSTWKIPMEEEFYLTCGTYVWELNLYIEMPNGDVRKDPQTYTTNEFNVECNQ